MITLERSNDRKVTTLASRDGKQSKLKNTFGLTQWASCPGRTPACDACYVRKNPYPAVDALLARNYATLLASDYATMVALIDGMIMVFETECERKGADKAFRIHWSGDFYSVEYARAWSVVIALHPDVEFWAYTRSFHGDVNVVDILADLPNLHLYLSVDAGNRQHVVAAKRGRKSVHLAYLATTFAEGKADMREITGKPGMSCQQAARKLPMITTAGGACITCAVCPEGKADVVFSVTKK